MNIKLDISENKFILSGDTSDLIKNRRYFMYLRNTFNINLTESSIEVTFDDYSKEEILSKLKKYLEKNNINIIKSERICENLNSYFIEEKNFEEFSKKALDIRNNNCDANEFRIFTEYLYKSMPNRRLYPLQLLSSYHLAFSQNSCNFSVPGAGKTSIVYGAFTYLNNLENDNPKKVNHIVIIGPLSSFGPWENEFFECFGKKPKVMRLSSVKNRSEKSRYFKSSDVADITLISYQGLPSIKDDLGFFMRQNKVMLVLDEAHKIKNTNGGIIASSILEIASYAKSRVALTGTPAPNGYEDLYNLFTFIWPKKNVVKYRLRQLREMSKNKNDNRVNDLIKNIEPFFIRIKKSDLNLPIAIDREPLQIEMGKEQKIIYEFIEKNYMDYLIEINGNRSSLKEYLGKARVVRLMQAATNPELLKKPIEKNIIDEHEIEDNFINDTDMLEKIMEYTEKEVPSKFKAALEIILKKIEKNEKIIVWSCYIDNIINFSNYLQKNGVNNKILYGAIPSAGNEDDSSEETRESIIKEFHNKDCDFNIIIANPFAVAESISLHKVCHAAIYMDRNFNAAQFLQSKDRIHRYGLDNTITTEYYYLVSKNSIDETINKRLAEKIERLELIIDNSNIPLFDNNYEYIGKDDMKEIIKDYVKRSK